jgi:hypothetical protein
MIRGKDAQGSVMIINDVTFPTELRDLYREINAEAIGRITLMLAVFAGLALLCSLFMKGISLDRGSRSTQSFVEIKDEVSFRDERDVAEMTLEEGAEESRMLLTEATRRDIL